MARPRAATDEQIIQVAEEIAAEKGWRNVYAKAVHDKMNVGGSLSTFTKAIAAWRSEKEADDQDQGEELTSGDVVDDRVSVIDESLSNVATVLKSMRDAVTNEIDRAVADERRKSDRVRADERELHERKMAERDATIDAISAENESLAIEAQAEAKRADAAEIEIGEMNSRIKLLEGEAAKIPEMSSQIETLTHEKEKIKADSEVRIAETQETSAAAIEKAEAREAAVVTDKRATEQKLDENRKELQSINSDLTTARIDLATVRAERAQSCSRAEAAEKKIQDLASDIERERTRADEAWSRVDALTLEMKAQKQGSRAERNGEGP